MKKMKFKFFSLIIILNIIANCASSPDHKQAKIYIGNLDSLLNQDSEEVASKIIDTWGFKYNKPCQAEGRGFKSHHPLQVNSSFFNSFPHFQSLAILSNFGVFSATDVKSLCYKMVLSGKSDTHNVKKD